jgi:hypothetical protein
MDPRGKFTRVIGDAVSDTAEQAYLYRLMISTEDDFATMQTVYRDAVGGNTDPATLKAGFGQIVQEFSRDDREIVRSGGEIGWTPRGILTSYDQVVFQLSIEELSEPVQVIGSHSLVFVFMVSESVDNKEVAAENIKVLRRRAPQEWLSDQRSRNELVAAFNSEIYDLIAAQVRETIFATPVLAQQSN